MATKRGQWQLICLCALSQFQSICEKITTGDITISELTQINDKQSQMNKLCESVATASESSLPSKSQFPTFNQLQKSLQQRLKEYECFKEYVSILSDFVNHLTGITSNGKLMIIKHFVMCSH